ncbi:MAG TPA: SDR family NAD(P)-dependent oxidoreductase [Mucilaginibacter sp.]
MAKLTCFFINAGIVGRAPIEQATEALFDSIIDINFKDAYFTLSKFIPQLNDGASVAFLSSNTATMNGALSSIYSSSKAALIQKSTLFRGALANQLLITISL